MNTLPKVLQTLAFGFSVACLCACGGGASSDLDLGGGIIMTADGQILGATPASPPGPDFLFSSEEEWKAHKPDLPTR